IMWRTMIAAVARAMKPGAKHDVMPILVGPQGIFKSTFWRTLASDPWFSDSRFVVGHRDAYLVLRGRWFVEMPELDALRRARDAEEIKAFLSSPVDRYRDPYGRTMADNPRTAIIVGTTNDDGFLSDPTGNRRFWPMRVGKIDVDWVAAHRDQLWAEAAHA